MERFGKDIKILISCRLFLRVIAVADIIDVMDSFIRINILKGQPF